MEEIYSAFLSQDYTLIENKFQFHVWPCGYELLESNQGKLLPDDRNDG